MYPFPPQLPSIFSSQTPPYMTPHPEPTTKDLSPGPFTLNFINNQIFKCQGCKGQTKTPGASLPPPPFDLIVSRMKCRPPNNSIRVPSNPSNAHYHLRMECLKAADPGFNPLSMVLPHDVKVSVEHKQLLSSNFGFLVFWFMSVHHWTGMVWVAWRLLWSYALCGFPCRLLWSYALCGFACRLLWSYVVLPVGYCEVMRFCL